ncbi:MAG: hypothetical protein WEB87_02185 [Bacteriovoracaceae bacterium]
MPKSMTLYEGGNEFFSSFSYFQSLQKADVEGQTVEFEPGERFSQMDLLLGGRYGFTDRLQLSLGLSLRYNSSVEIDNQIENTASTSGVKSGLVQIKYVFPNQENWQLALEANYEPSLFTNSSDENDTDIALGDDGNSSSFGTSATYFFKSQNFLSGKVLYRNPSENLSSEIVSELEGVLAWDSFSILAGVENVTSLEQDPYGVDPENKPSFNTGSTNLYNSVNRSWTAPYAGLNIAFGKHWRLEGKVASRIAGSSTDLGNTYLLTLARRESESKAFAQKYSAFKEYTVEASVVKLTKSKSSVIIDAGMVEGLEKGSRIDFYHFDYMGGNDLIASGYIVKLGASKSLVKITKRHSKKRVEEGTLARGGLIQQ